MQRNFHSLKVSEVRRWKFYANKLDRISRRPFNYRPRCKSRSIEILFAFGISNRLGPRRQTASQARRSLINSKQTRGSFYSNSSTALRRKWIS